MSSLIKRLFAILTQRQRKIIFVLQIFIIIKALFEIATMALIGYFTILITDISRIDSNVYLNYLYQMLEISSQNYFMALFGVLIFIFLLVKGFMSLIHIWVFALFFQRVQLSIKTRLYQYYMCKNWLFHTLHESSYFTTQINTETARLMQIIKGLMGINTDLVLVIFITVSLAVINPIMVVSMVGTFAAIYLVIYKIIKEKLTYNGRTISKYSLFQYKLIAEGFGGIKDILLLNCQSNFINHFRENAKKVSDSRISNELISGSPQTLIELLTVGSTVFLIIYLFRDYDANPALILSTLAVYTFAGFKLLPTFQRLYKSITTIKASMAAFYAIEEDLKNSSVVLKLRKKDNLELTNPPLDLKHSIELRAITFTYPRNKGPALNNLNLTIYANQTIGLVGASGAGKSTSIDILLGLIKPDMGDIIIDGRILYNSNLRAWQDNCGYVPQRIFLMNQSIVRNIAFGVAEEKIDLTKVKKVIQLAHLDDVMQELPKGIYTSVGEKGVRLSGGQCQRLGIARALYHDAKVLVLDEATSSLDGITERLIIDAIADFSGKKTIIMIAHKLKTVEKCDKIFFMDKGQVIDAGTYHELSTRNALFNEMFNVQLNIDLTK